MLSFYQTKPWFPICFRLVVFKLESQKFQLLILIFIEEATAGYEWVWKIDGFFSLCWCRELLGLFVEHKFCHFYHIIPGCNECQVVGVNIVNCLVWLFKENWWGNTCSRVFYIIRKFFPCILWWVNFAYLFTLLYEKTFFGWIFWFLEKPLVEETHPDCTACAPC